MSSSTELIPSATRSSRSARIPGVSISQPPGTACGAGCGSSWCAGRARRPRGSPGVATVAPVSALASVDLPTPDEPASATVSPGPHQGSSRATAPGSRAFTASIGSDVRQAPAPGRRSPPDRGRHRPWSATPPAAHRPCRASARYRSSRATLKSALHELTMNSVSRLAAISWGLGPGPGRPARDQRLAREPSRRPAGIVEEQPVADGDVRGKHRGAGGDPLRAVRPDHVEAVAMDRGDAHWRGAGPRPGRARRGRSATSRGRAGKAYREAWDCPVSETQARRSAPVRARRSGEGRRRAR